MTDYAARKAELTAILNAAQPGQTIKLDGDYNFPVGQGHRWGPKSTSPKDEAGNLLPVGSRGDPITLDCRSAIIGDLNWSKIEGITFLGGEHAGPVRIDGGSRITFEEIRSHSPGKQIGINGGRDIKLVRSRMIDGDYGIAVGGIDGLLVDETAFIGMAIDGVHFSSCSNLRIQWNAFLHSRPGLDPNTGKPVHPDAVQGANNPGAPGSSNLIIRRNLIRGKTQGIFLGNKGAGYDNVLVEENHIETSYSQALGFEDVRGGRVLRNKVSTYDAPGANMANIIIVRSPGTVLSGNTIADGAGKKGRVDADVSGGEAAKVADLQAQLAAATAAAAAELGKANAQIASAETARDALAAKVEAARTALS